MKRRGRPTEKTRQELIADDVLARIFVEQDSAKEKGLRLVGQRRLPTPFIKRICADVAGHHGVTTRTAETYFYRHHQGWRARWLSELNKKLDASNKADLFDMQRQRNLAYEKLIKSIK